MVGIRLMKRIGERQFGFMGIVLLVCVLVPMHSTFAQDDLAELTDAKSDRILAILHPLKTAILSSEVSTVVSRIHREMGEEFRQDDVLISLDATLFAADKKSAEAALASATSAFGTSSELYDQHSISEVQFAKAKADLEIAEANVAIANKKLTACTIRAPYRGQVVKLFVNENEFVRQGQPLTEIIDDRTMRAKFMAPSVFYGHLKIGQQLSLKLRGFPREFKCRITHISPMLESNTSTFQVFAEIDNTQNILQGGMTGEILLEPIKEQ